MTDEEEPVTASATDARHESLRGQPERRATGTARGQLLYLVRTGQIVVPDQRHADGWRCVVVAQPGRPYASRDMFVPDREIETALTVATVDPVTDPDTFAYVWQARIWPRWPGGPMPALARELAQELRTAGTRDVEVDEATARRLAVRHRIPIDGIRRALANLVRAGLLRHDGPVPWGTYTLAIPASRDRVLDPPAQPTP
jgi:hypothetical protein